MASTTPAQLIGLGKRVGAIADGLDAITWFSMSTLPSSR
jgi:N-acetylglucosamine-6-phosphate deacetylase